MGMLSSVTKAVGGFVGDVLGFSSGPSQGDINAQSAAAYEAEQQRLKAEAEQKRREARFLRREGKGKRRAPILTFGNRERMSGLTNEQRSVRGTGQFANHRLVL